MKRTSHLERKFWLCWQARKGPNMLIEYRFAAPRKWRFDFAHVESKTGIEIEGGHWTGGRHTRGSGFQADCEKYLEAALLGWTVIRLTSNMVNLTTVERIVEFVNKKSAMSDEFPRPSGDCITDRKRQRAAEAQRQAHSLQRMVMRDGVQEA